MTTNRGWTALVALAAMSLPLAAFANEADNRSSAQEPAKKVEGNTTESAKEAPKQEEKKDGDKKPLTNEQKEALSSKQDKMKELQEKAENVTKQMGALASSGKLPTDAEALEAMKKMVQEMQQINDQLRELREEVDAIKGWIEGQNESLPIIAQGVSDLQRTRFGNYLQFQYRDSNEQDAQRNFIGQHSFQMRRVRISTTQTIDSKTSLRFSFDLATGTNTVQAQLRDAFIIYDIVPSFEQVGIQLNAGQLPLPLGYELERSSADREFPERATYNRVMFDGERSRGAILRYGLGPNSFVFAGLVNALTFNDPEQRDIAPGPRGRLAGLGGIRYYTNTFDIGVSTFIGDRPAYRVGNVTSPEVDRQFLYFDATLVGLLVPELSFRGELMLGKDRVPNATPAANRFGTDMVGWQTQLNYNISDRNILSFRLAQFDPDKDRDGNAITEYGAVYNYFINPNTRIGLAHEVFHNPTRSPRQFRVTTLRYQIRF